MRNSTRTCPTRQVPTAPSPRLLRHLLAMTTALALLGAGADAAADAGRTALATDTPFAGAAAHAAEDRSLTRAEVRESLRTAMDAGLMLRAGEIAEPPELLQAREDFIAMQTEQMHKAYQAAVDRNERLTRAGQARQDEALARLDAERVSRLVDEATDRLPEQPGAVEIWVEPGTTIEQLMAYIEQTADRDAVVIVLVDEAAPEPAD